ncbi:MAG: hypothetical protein LQ338_001354 [Usnochroma carphineum]|nr:MAG: hypothetical protein LQ338_001354 [Usnochroma carphineum]
MRTHRPSRNQNNQRRNQIPLRPPVPFAGQPYPKEARAPPHYTHARVLEVVPYPGPTPAVLRESIDATPRRDEQGIEEFLRPPRPPEPPLAHEQQDRQHDPVPDERAAHDEMRQTLSQMILSAKPQRRDPAEEHLHPAYHGHQFSDNTVEEDEVAAYATVDAPFEMEFEVDAQNDLGDEEEGEDGGERGVDVWGELAAAMDVAEDVAEEGEERAESLEGDVPARADDLGETEGGERMLWGGEGVGRTNP